MKIPDNQSLREYIEHLREEGYSVQDGHTPDPDLIDPQGNPVYTWQEGYPYETRMDREEYELQQYQPQVATRPARAARSSASPSTSTPAPLASSR